MDRIAPKANPIVRSLAFTGILLVMRRVGSDRLGRFWPVPGAALWHRSFVSHSEYCYDILSSMIVGSRDEPSGAAPDRAMVARDGQIEDDQA
jgi:hypothetical protein